MARVARRESDGNLRVPGAAPAASGLGYETRHTGVIAWMLSRSTPNLASWDRMRVGGAPSFRRNRAQPLQWEGGLQRVVWVARVDVCGLDVGAGPVAKS